jgi:hypothetical protein
MTTAPPNAGTERKVRVDVVADPGAWCASRRLKPAFNRALTCAPPRPPISGVGRVLLADLEPHAVGARQSTRPFDTHLVNRPTADDV